MMKLRTLPFLVGALLASVAAAAFAQPAEEMDRAAILPKFARYVEWPAAARPGPRQPFQLCVIGVDTFGPRLEQTAAREAVADHAIVVRRHPSADQPAGCHIAYVQGPTPNDTTRLLLALRAQPILTVTDARAGPQRGMIHFTDADGRVRFFIDEAEAADRGLTVSSRLLALALGVRQRR